MKRLFTLSIFAALIFGGCQNESIVENNPESDVFYATIEDNGTKTSLDESGNVFWKQGDQVSVFDGNTLNSRYQVTDASDGKTSATLNEIASVGFFAGTEIYSNVALYPYASGNSIEMNADSYVLSFTLPATQNYAANSFGNGAFPMVAVTGTATDKNLSFKNVLGGLKLQLKGTASIRSVTVTGNNNEILYGAATVTAKNGSTPAISLSDASAKTVTLDCGTGVQLNTTTATAFIIALPPMTMSAGFTVVVTEMNGRQMELKTVRSQTIARSNLLRMPELNYVGAYDFVDLGLPSGAKWATFNVGATKAEEYGDYFAWGATAPLYDAGYAQENPQAHWKSGYDTGYVNNNTPYHTAIETKWTKYLGTATSNYKDASANDADAVKYVLDLTDDAARVNWGGSWRMPTFEEWAELNNTSNCDWIWTTQDGINGYKVQSKQNGNWIFLPVSGYRSYTSLSKVGSEGCYWSGSLRMDAPYDAQYFYLSSSDHSTSFGRRYYGRTIRPVCSDDPNSGITGVSLDKSEMPIFVGSTKTLAAMVTKNAGTVNTQVEWSSSNTSVATVDCNGNVTAQAVGSATITARTVFGGYTATCSITVLPAPEYVDLGLSVKWATFNVGATAPEEYGDRFAWGETSPKTDYSWRTYKYSLGSYDAIKKYCNNGTYSYYPEPDNITVLTSEDDAATVHWDGLWRIPTVNEWEELNSNCTWTKTTLNGVNGYMVTSNKNGYTDKSIFLPNTGCYDGTTLKGVGKDGVYWSSSLHSTYPYYARIFILIEKTTFHGTSEYERYCGLSVRPVCP